MTEQKNSRPALDADCRALIDALTAAGGVFEKPDAAQMRAAYLKTNALYNPPTPELRRVENTTVPGDGGPLPAVPIRVYHPHGAPESNAPALVFLHGGGWILGDLETHDALCRILAVRSDAVVVSVDYRLAPEHIYPAAVDDCERAWLYVHQNAGDFGIDPARMAMGGDSAGGNLTAAVTLRLRDAGQPLPVLQLLIYPATDFTTDEGSMIENAEGYVLTRESIHSMGSIYLGDSARAVETDASPLLAKDHTGLPPALVQVAGYDPLRDQGVAYANRLREAGVAVQLLEYPSVVHGFMRMIKPVAMAQVGLDDAAAALRRVFQD